jgi:hypothetical protein
MRTSPINGTIRGKLAVCGVAAVAALSAAGITSALVPGHSQLAYHNLTPVKLTAVTRVLSQSTVSGGAPSYIVTESGSIGNGSAAAIEVACPSGYTLTGGGTSVGPVNSNGEPEGIGNAYVTASYAEHSGSTSTAHWLGVATNFSGSTLTLTVQAVCD